ncbi:MAG: orotidine-5'-phosphate decarboxylase [Bacteroidota bacterium]|nr:orotidine-5'-phosphate decarboxylase [Bacteroidota bacterium]
MTLTNLTAQIRSKNSYLCVGLDTTLEKIPPSLRTGPDPIFEFNRQIIDATMDLCVAYKINTAFYEVMGAAGWDILARTAAYIPSTHLRIADAKRGDIGNTSHQYARAFFETLDFDAVTVAPYMGSDSIRPFLEYPGKWTIVLGLTSNEGSGDFQQQPMGQGMLYERVIEKVSGWGSPDNLMFVVGATKASEIASIRKIIPHHFLLIPGVGFQGGSLKDVSQAGLNEQVGLLVNSSRAIIYASQEEDFASVARQKAREYQSEMKSYL